MKMGYTNYLTIKPTCPSALFTAALKRDLLKVIKAGVKVLADGGGGKGKPIVTDTEIVFNGKGDEGSYETCVLPLVKPIEDFYFCKTAGREYDKFVLCSYFVMKKHIGEYCEVSSDGHQFEPEVPNGYHAFCEEEVEIAFELFCDLFKVSGITIDDLMREGKLPLILKGAKKPKLRLLEAGK